MRSLMLLLLVVVRLQADPVAQLRTTLSNFQAGDPLKLSVSYQLSSQGDDDDESRAEQSSATVVVEHGPAGLVSHWSAEIMAQLAQEARPKADGADTPKVGRAMNALNAGTLHNYLDAAPQLLRSLERVELQRERTEVWEGQTVRVLTFKVNPLIDEKNRKFIKELDATAQLWMDLEGVPLALEVRTRVKGRAYLVINFQSEDVEEFRYQMVGQRLVVVRHSKTSRQSGTGGSNRRTILATAQVLP
jgi:hypothetical protein